MSVPNSSHPWLTLQEAADELRVSPRTVRRLISSGDLVAKRVGRQLIRVSAASVANAGRPIGRAQWEAAA